MEQVVPSHDASVCWGISAEHMSSKEKDSAERIALHLKTNSANAFVEVRLQEVESLWIFGTYFLDLQRNQDGIAEALRKGSVAESCEIYAYTWDGNNAAAVPVIVLARDIAMLGDGDLVLPAHKPHGYSPNRLSQWAFLRLMGALLDELRHLPPPPTPYSPY